MAQMLLLVLFLRLIMCHVEALSVMDWVWGKRTDDTSVLIADGVPLISIPYESMTDDEKFLQEAAKFTEIQISSPLETCQHKVIMKLKISCSTLSEEQLAKLSVNLLNCQSAVEGRKMFPCTEEMSLKQCTTDMDADMWNAYHLMSNRARAVCYAARSTQFRALTELTVNKLMQSAHSQIETLGSLKATQDRLEEQTIDALSSLSKGNDLLLQQQQHIKDAQISAQELVASNLRELNHEKALIRFGHSQLATMAKDIKNKLERARADIGKHALERTENHKEILRDLRNIQQQAQLIWDKIEMNTNRIVAQHEDVLSQYEQTLEKLTQINDTIQFLWNVTSKMRIEVDEKLGWITSYVGDTGEQLHRVYRTAIHIVYLLIAMVVAAFLQAPFLTRATIMGLVPLNLATYLKHGMEACLDFTSMTALIFLITGMHFVMNGIQCAMEYIMCIQRSKVNKYTLPPKLEQLSQTTKCNGNIHRHTSPTHSTSPTLHAQITKRGKEIYALVYTQINCCIEKIYALIQSAASWSRQSLSIHEELSCSYVSSKRTREDIVYDCDTDYANISDDRSQIYTPDTTAGRHNRLNDLTDFIDESSTDNYVAEMNTVNGRQSVNRITPRSLTPQFSPRHLCDGMTRSGRRCRLFAARGRPYCSRHTSGSSMMGD